MKKILSILFVLIASQVASQSFELPSVHLEELTSPEVGNALDNGYKSIIIPTGGTEQNGPHMVLGKHNFRVKYLAQEIALKLSDAIVAPTIAYVPEGQIDPPKGWMHFPGTIHLPEEYFIKLIEFTARSFKQHGFVDIILIGDSGGNQNGLKIVAETLNIEWKDTNVRVHYISQFYDPGTSVLDSLEAEGIDPKYYGGHAGLTDVSSLLAIDQNLLRMDIMEGLDFNDQRDRKLGYTGDPSMSNEKIGKRLNDETIRESVRQIKKLREENRN